MHSQAEPSSRKKTPAASRDGKVQGQEEFAVQRGCVLSWSSEDDSSTGRLGCMWAWDGAGDWSEETSQEALATSWMRSERVVAVKMEGRDGCEKCFHRAAYMPPNPLD